LKKYNIESSFSQDNVGKNFSQAAETDAADPAASMAASGLIDWGAMRAASVETRSSSRPSGESQGKEQP
jgi:hypothetical protein